MRARFLVLAMAAVSLALAGAVIAQQSLPPAPRPDVTITTKDLMAGLSNPARWLTYSGDYSGSATARSSRSRRRTSGSSPRSGRSRPRSRPGKFEATPIVIDGVIYQTGPLNYAWAIDAKTGRQIWHYQRLLPPGTMKVCCGLVNRGFAVYGNRLFMTTLDAHLVALDLKTGKEVWDVGDGRLQGRLRGTGAPLIVKDKVVVGIAGGEFAIRGFLDAYEVQTGQRAWRFWTIPAPGEPGSNTWPADTWERGGAPTWLTGTYDPETNLMYWGTGNPNPDLYGGNRPATTCIARSVVALDADTGTLKWHYQFTPHDEHDWDANQIPVLGDLTSAGSSGRS